MLSLEEYAKNVDALKHLRIKEQRLLNEARQCIIDQAKVLSIQILHIRDAGINSNTAKEFIGLSIQLAELLAKLN